MRSYAKPSAIGIFLRLLVLVGVEVGSVPALKRLGSLPYLTTPGASISAWEGWLRSTAPQDAVISVLRLVATGCAWWLLATTVLYLAARVIRIPVPRLLGALEWTTPAPIRRLVDRAVALSMVATLAGAGAAFASAGGPPDPAPVVVVVDGQPGVLLPPGARPGTLPAPTPQPPAPRPPVPAVTGSGGPPPAGTSGPDPASHRVVPGDNLWKIAAERLGLGLGPGVTVSNGRIAPYWLEIVQRNRAGLRSHDPDLIFPGETVALPPAS